MQTRTIRLRPLMMTSAAVLLCATSLWAADDAGPGGTTALDHFLFGGGWITYLVLVPLSFATIALSIDHLLYIRRGVLTPPELKAALDELLAERRFKEALDLVTEDTSLLGGMVLAGLSHASAGLNGMRRAMEEVLEFRAASLFRRIEYLNIIGNLSPMIGLFGTVFGMIKTFSAIVEQGGQPDATSLAQGISIALVTTFWGLLVAIPALSVFHLMRNRIDGLMAGCALAGEELLDVFRQPPKSATPAQKRPSATPPAPQVAAQP